jgi:hypothetical protein
VLLIAYLVATLGSILGSKVVNGVDSYKTVYKANYITKHAIKTRC